jgi:hypothetical protein
MADLRGEVVADSGALHQFLPTIEWDNGGMGEWGDGGMGEWAHSPITPLSHSPILPFPSARQRLEHWRSGQSAVMITVCPAPCCPVPPMLSDTHSSADLSHHTNHSQQPSSTDPDLFRNNYHHMKISLDDSAIDAYRDGQDSYPSLKRVNSFSNVSRKSFDDAMMSDPRMMRLQQTEAAIRKEMFKECTFRPQIKNLPAAYGPLKETGTAFVDRMEKWKREKELQLQLKQKIKDRSSLEDCSFKPKINRYSDRAVKEIRGSSPETAHERLFKSSLQLIEQRKKLLEDEYLKEEQSLEAQCTFKPKLVTKSSNFYQQVQPKFNRVDITKKEEISQKPNPSMGKSCTFTPKVSVFTIRLKFDHLT